MLSWSASSRASQAGSSALCMPASAPLNELGEGAGVAVADRVGVLEVLERVLADGLEHAEAAAVAGEQALVGERGDAVERVGAADGLGGGEGEAAGEDAELGEQLLRRGSSRS